MIQSAHGPSVHLRYDDGNYQCPHCFLEYLDGDKMETRIMKNKRGYTWKTCDGCGERFGICSNPRSGIIAFDLSEAI